MEHEIIIVEANEATGELVLEINGVNADTICVKRFHQVNWSIAASNVASFKIKKKGPSPRVFLASHPPPANHTRRGGGRIHPFAEIGAVYEYSIIWKAKGSNKEHEHDPKIAIMPSRVDFLKLIIGFILGLFTLLTLNFLRKKRNRN